MLRSKSSALSWRMTFSSRRPLYNRSPYDGAPLQCDGFSCPRAPAFGDRSSLSVASLALSRDERVFEARARACARVGILDSAGRGSQHACFRRAKQASAGRVTRRSRLVQGRRLERTSADARKSRIAQARASGSYRTEHHEAGAVDVAPFVRRASDAVQAAPTKTRG